MSIYKLYTSVAKELNQELPGFNYRVVVRAGLEPDVKCNDLTTELAMLLPMIDV